MPTLVFPAPGFTSSTQLTATFNGFDLSAVTGSTATNLSYPVGTYVLLNSGYGAATVAASVTPYVRNSGGGDNYVVSAPGGGKSALSGSWRARGSTTPGPCGPEGGGQGGNLAQRTA